MINKILRKASYFIAPKLTEDLSRRFYLSKQVSLLKKRCSADASMQKIVDEVMAVDWIAPAQKKSEITEFLQLLKGIRPKRILEIGGWKGGTLFLFCHIAKPDACLLSIDINYSRSQQIAYQKFGNSKQKITCMVADSHSERTLNRVKKWLSGCQLDLLFIDGDHSLEGVSSDYSMYAPLVRPGGIIAFHDIVPDSNTRFGIPTGSYVGQVPTFWAGLKMDNSDLKEIIENPSQDGYGIGIINRNPSDGNARNSK